MYIIMNSNFELIESSPELSYLKKVCNELNRNSRNRYEYTIYNLVEVPRRGIKTINR